MNKILEYINHYPKETKRVIGIGAQKLKTLIENAHIVSESTANNIFYYWVDILRELLPPSLLQQLSEKEDEYLWIQEFLTEQELIVDSTEQSRNRPNDDNKQKNIILEARKTIHLKIK